MCSAIANSPRLFALADAGTVLGDRLRFVGQVEAQQVGCLVGHLHRLGHRRRRPAEIVDLLGENERVLQLFAGVDLQLLRDRHVLSALQDLRVHHVGNDRLVFASEVAIQEIDQLRAGDVRGRGRGIGG